MITNIAFKFFLLTLLSLLLLPLYDDGLLVLPLPLDFGQRRPLALADQGRVVVFAHTYR